MWRDEHLVLDMLIHARKARGFNAGVTWERFSTVELLQAATQYVLQVIGEAASKVSDDYRLAHPELPWKQIVGFRHAGARYRRIDSSKVWHVVQNHIDALIKMLEPLVPPPPPPESP